MTIELCDDDHIQIAYDRKEKCPLCEALNKHEDYEDEIKRLEIYIEKLGQELEDYKSGKS
jgi:hypothetical protein